MKKSFEQQPSPTLLMRKDQVGIALQMSPRTLQRMKITKQIPLPVKIPGRRGVWWRRVDIEKWVAGLRA